MFGFHEGLDIGLDRRSPVSWERRRGVFRYSGTIHELMWKAGRSRLIRRSRTDNRTVWRNVEPRAIRSRLGRVAGASIWSKSRCR